MSAARLRRQWSRAVLVVVASCGPGLCAAQTSAAQAAKPARAELAADETTLWLAEVTGEQTRIFRRDVTEPFQLVPDVLYAPVTGLVARERGLYAFTTRGELYALTPGTPWQTRPAPPGRRQPLAAVGSGTLLYALVESPPPGGLPRLIDGRRPAESQPFDSGAAGLTLAQLDPQGWIAVAPVPLDYTPGGPAPLLNLIHEELVVLALAPDGQSVRLLFADLAAAKWQEQDVPLGAPADRVLFANLNRVPTIITQVRGTRPPQLAALRLFGGADTPQWRPAALQLSPLPTGAEPLEYRDAFGFNQHLVLHVAGPSGTSWLQYARIEAAPAEATVATAEVFATRGLTREGPGWIHGGALLLLLLVLLALFLFRRGAMVAILTLPQGVALAFAFQRMLTFAVDLLPFALIFALLLRVDWQTGFRELLSWALGSDATAGSFPHFRTLQWWGLTVGAHTVYTLAMELLTRRTVGKVLSGTRVHSETGGPPRAWQVVARNLVRILELLPPLWILLLLVVLSRNRQRLGDIFARTVVVRRVPTTTPPPAPPAG